MAGSEPGEPVTCDPWPGGPPVAPPVMTPCPAGWREVPATDPDGAPTCDPWPDGGRHTCADDEAHFPGEPARSRVGSPCPTGDWADDLPASDVVFVRAGAPSGGDGTRGSPFSTIAEATAVADPGTTIALGKGSYDESVRLGPGCTLWGACVALTVVDRSVASDSDAAIEVTGADTMVRNLLVTGQSPGLVAAGAATSLEIEDVIVAGASVRGVRVTGGATVTAHDLVVRDTAGSALDGTRGRGVQVEEGATVTLRRAAVERNRHIGVFVTDAGSTLTMTDVVVAETREQTSDGEHGVGLHVQSGGQVDATRIALERNLAAGAMAGSAGTMLRLTDAVVRDTLGDTHGRFGMGLGVGQGATAEVERVLLQANRTAALLAADAGTVLTVLDVVARGPVSEAPSGDFGRGVDVTAGARAELERVELTAHRGAAVFADGSSTSLVLADLVARDTQTRTSDGGGGTGLLAQHAAQVMSPAWWRRVTTRQEWSTGTHDPTLVDWSCGRRSPATTGSSAMGLASRAERKSWHGSCWSGIGRWGVGERRRLVRHSCGTRSSATPVHRRAATNTAPDSRAARRWSTGRVLLLATPTRRVRDARGTVITLDDALVRDTRATSTEGRARPEVQEEAEPNSSA